MEESDAHRLGLQKDFETKRILGKLNDYSGPISPEKLKQMQQRAAERPHCEHCIQLQVDQQHLHIVMYRKMEAISQALQMRNNNETFRPGEEDVGNCCCLRFTFLL